MLPQGMFSVALATVLFPALSRFAARTDFDGLRASLSTGIRQIFLLLAPGRRFHRRARHADRSPGLPARRLRRRIDRAGLHRAVLVLLLPALAGANLLLTRTFFSLQKPWTPTAIAAGNLVVNAVLSLLLYKPFGIAGLVISTAVASIGMTLRRPGRLTDPSGGDR